MVVDVVAVGGVVVDVVAVGGVVVLLLFVGFVFDELVIGGAVVVVVVVVNKPCQDVAHNLHEAGNWLISDDVTRDITTCRDTRGWLWPSLVRLWLTLDVCFVLLLCAVHAVNRQ